jgi:hypothetical protein
MVARYKRQVRSGEIGVIRADMSVANSLGQISNAVSKMSNEAFKMAADKAEERGRDYISSKSDDEIFGIDPETGQPKNVLTELLADLPSKGYGMIAQDAIKQEASKRFGLVLETKFKEQGANAQAKFPLNPGKAKSMLEEFTDELASKYEGEYKNKITSFGEAYASGINNTLLIRQANNQISVSLQNNELMTASFLQRDGALAETANQNTVNKMIDDALNPKSPKLKNIHQSANRSNTLSGGKALSSSQLSIKHASTIATSRIKAIMKKYAGDDLVTVMKMNQVVNSADIDKLEGVDATDKENLKKMFTHVVADPEGRSNLFSSLRTFIAGENQIQNFIAQERRANEVEIDASLNEQINNQKVRFLSYQGGEMADSFTQEIQALPNIESKIEFANQRKQEVRTQGNKILEGKTVDGETVRASKSVLTDTEINKISNSIDRVVAQSVSADLIGAFQNDDGTLDSTKLRQLSSAILNNVRMGKALNVESLTKGMTPIQKKAVKDIVPSITKMRNVGAGGLEQAGGEMNLELDTRRAVVDNIKTEINNSNQLASELANQAKIKNFSQAVTNKEPLENSTENRENADDYIKAIASEIPELQGKNVREILLSEQFANPNGDLRKAFDSLLQNNLIVSNDTKNLISDLRKGLVSGQSASRFLDFVVKGTVFSTERQLDGSNRYTQFNVFRVDEETERDVIAIQQAFKVSQLTGGQLTISQVLQNEQGYLKSPEYEDKIKEITGKDTFQKAQTELAERIAKTPTVTSAGGNGSRFHKRIMNAIPHIIYQNRNTRIDIDDLQQQTKAIMTDFFPATEDYVMDPQSVSINGKIRSSFAMNRLFPTDELKTSFLDYTQAKLETYGDYDIRTGFRDGIESPGGNFFVNIISGIGSAFSPDTPETGAKKAWLVPSQFASTDPFSEDMANPDKHNVTFFLSEGMNGEMSFIVSERNIGQVSMREFRHWRKTGKFLDEE